MDAKCVVEMEWDVQPSSRFVRHALVLLLARHLDAELDGTYGLGVNHSGRRLEVTVSVDGFLSDSDEWAVGWLVSAQVMRAIALAVADLEEPVSFLSMFVDPGTEVADPSLRGRQHRWDQMRALSVLPPTSRQL